MTGSEEEKDTQDSELKGGWSFRLVCITGVAYLIIPMVAFALTCLNAPSELVKEFINETELERNGEPLTESEVESLFGLLVAVVALGALTGALVADAVAERIGRKYTLMIASATGTVGSLIMALCRTANAYEMLFVGRTISGIALGAGLDLAPPYIMEMCLPHQKGVAALANMVCQGFGIILSDILGFEELLGNDDYWHYLIGFPVIIGVTHLLLFPLCPQNPRFLLMNKNDEEGAVKALQTIKGHKDVEEDLRNIRTEAEDSATDVQVTVIKLFTTKKLRRPLMVTIAMGLHQNWCGMNGILLFSTQLFEDAGLTSTESRYATAGVGLFIIIGNLSAVFMLPHFGRKTMFLVGSIGIGICCAVFALTMVFKDEVDALKYVSIVVSLILMFLYAAGPVSVFWVILGEMLPHSARGAAVSVGLFFVFSGFFSHCYAFPAMLDVMDSYTFFIFAGINVIMVVFSFIFMPETKDKSFPEIVKLWSKDGQVEPEEESKTDTKL